MTEYQEARNFTVNSLLNLSEQKTYAQLPPEYRSSWSADNKEINNKDRQSTLRQHQTNTLRHSLSVESRIKEGHLIHPSKTDPNNDIDFSYPMSRNCELATVRLPPSDDSFNWNTLQHSSIKSAFHEPNWNTANNTCGYKQEEQQFYGSEVNPSDDNIAESADDPRSAHESDVEETFSLKDDNNKGKSWKDSRKCKMILFRNLRLYV